MTTLVPTLLVVVPAWVLMLLGGWCLLRAAAMEAPTPPERGER